MSPELIYGLIAVVPALILIVMVIFGLGDDFDAGGLEIEAEFDIGDAGPGFFGVKLILSFVIGFGLAGFLAQNFAWRIPPVLAGVIGGAVVYTVVYQLLKFLYRQQSNTPADGSSVAGRPGLVTSAIPKGGTGEIKAELPATGRSIYLRARAVDPEKGYPAGSEVTVKNVIAGLAKVE